MNDVVPFDFNSIALRTTGSYIAHGEKLSEPVVNLDDLDAIIGRHAVIVDRQHPRPPLGDAIGARRNSE